MNSITPLVVHDDVLVGVTVFLSAEASHLVGAGVGVGMPYVPVSDPLDSMA